MSEWKERLVMYQDAGDILDYTFEWAAWLNGASIAAFSITAVNGITVADVSSVGTAVTGFLSSGAVGQQYRISCQITTDNIPARVVTKSFYLEIKPT